ncbi:23S rRNA (adenine(2503)-C(2))-methyltransferase RlmN [Rurimicrobium arvi]|uniref:23S rRNA (Adenine(2503)-C(2))-methyltransferase RlmN n=1 Tax=Rurimicrobium arvi TaxID=2049916 RepID=A0ABP8MKX8_9BACT
MPYAMYLCRPGMKNIRTYSRNDLQDIALSAGVKATQGNVLFHAIWNLGVRSFEAVEGLNAAFLQLLLTEYFLPLTQIQSRQHSKDGTIKCVIQLHDGLLVESVLIPAGKRMTVCVSSQVGCSLSCKFCATGFMDRQRNLLAHEIHDQVFLLNELAQEQYAARVSNVVFMGMGEPLLNFREVLAAVERIQDQRGLSVAPKRITVSTAGIAKMIRALADDGRKLNLALSLHAANDRKRNEIMAINETNSLGELKDALEYFGARTGNDITLEYILLRNFNDSPEDAQELLEFYRNVPVHLINIIEYNPIDEVAFLPSEKDRTDAFAQYLLLNGANACLRRSRGKDIDAACGQLAGKEQTE